MTSWNYFRMLLITLVTNGYLTTSIGNWVISSMGCVCFSTIGHQSLQVLLSKGILRAVADVTFISSWSSARSMTSTRTSSIICDFHIWYFIMLNWFWEKVCRPFQWISCVWWFEICTRCVDITLGTNWNCLHFLVQMLDSMFIPYCIRAQPPQSFVLFANDLIPIVEAARPDQSLVGSSRGRGQFRRRHPYRWSLLT